MFGRKKAKKAPPHPNDEAKAAMEKEAGIKPKVSKDPFEQGFNQGMDDGKAGQPRSPHDLKRAVQLVMMNGKKVEQYVRGYHQGYDTAIKSKRIEHERELNHDARYEERLQRRAAIREQHKQKQINKDGPDFSP